MLWVLIDVANALTIDGCNKGLYVVTSRLHEILNNISDSIPCEVFLFVPKQFDLHREGPKDSLASRGYTRQIGKYATKPIKGNPLKRKTLDDRIHIYGTRYRTEEDDILLLLLAKRLEKYSQEQKRPRTICNSYFKKLFVGSNHQRTGWPKKCTLTDTNKIYCITEDKMEWYKTT